MGVITPVSGYQDYSVLTNAMELHCLHIFRSLLLLTPWIPTILSQAPPVVAPSAPLAAPAAPPNLPAAPPANPIPPAAAGPPPAQLPAIPAAPPAPPAVAPGPVEPPAKPVAPPQEAPLSAPPQLNAARVTGERSSFQTDAEEDEELSRLLSQAPDQVLGSDRVTGEDSEADAGETETALTPGDKNLESSRVREAALDDKLGVELRSIVEQIQEMQKEVADALQDEADI